MNSRKCESPITLLIRANQVISEQIIFGQGLVTSKLIDNIKRDFLAEVLILTNFSKYKRQRLSFENFGV